MSKALTIKELKKLLSKMPDDTLVMLSKDEAGNAFSPLGGYSIGTYIPGENPWQQGIFCDEGELISVNAQAQKAIALWPII